MEFRVYKCYFKSKATLKELKKNQPEFNLNNSKKNQEKFSKRRG